MSAKTELRWESPLDIYVPHELNNRPLDEGYVESLEDSMISQGYLPTYPVICYHRLELPKEVFDGKTDALYICAAGFHRTTAAKNINLDKIRVELRRGTFEDYLETLHTDNFQFDPSVDTSLGQIWTKTEKRKACKQLLLLPKYFKLANVALAELWHTSEGNVRRWRDEMASLINDGSLDAPFPISEEWQSKLKEILDSNVREMSDGSVVKVRSKSKDDKYGFYFELQKQVEKHKDLDWDTQIEPYCKKMYDVKRASDLSMKKLAELSQLIQIHDPEFMAMCKLLGEEKQKLNAAQAECHKAYRAAKDALHAFLIAQDLIEDRYISQHSEDYKNCWKAFGRAVSRVFGHNLLGSMLYTDKVVKYENETYQLEQLKAHIESGADFVEQFAQRQVNAQWKKRSKLGQAVIRAHYKMITAVQEKYPGIDMEKFCFAVDADCSLWLDVGDTPTRPIHAVINIPEDKKTGALPRIAEHYEEMLEKIEKGEDWIAKLVPSPAEVQLTLQRQTAEQAETELWKVFEASEYSMCFYREDLLAAASKAIGCPKEIPELMEMKNPSVWTKHFQAIQTAIQEKSDWIQELLKEKKAFNSAHTSAEYSLSTMWSTFEGLNYAYDMSRETFAIAAAKHLKCYQERDYGSGENYLLEKDYALLKNLTTSELRKWRKRFEKIEDALLKKADWIKALIPTETSEDAESTPKTVADVLGGGEVFFIKMSWWTNGNSETVYFENNTTSQDGVELSEVPEHLLAELLQIAKGGKREG